jgi:hypothetical protein
MKKSLSAFSNYAFSTAMHGKVLTTFLTDTLLTTFDMELQVLASGENLATFLTIKPYLHHLCINVLSYLLCLHFPLLLSKYVSETLDFKIFLGKKPVHHYTLLG